MKKVRFGVLSTAKIGVEKVIPAMQRSEHCEIVAIASRELDRAQQAAATLGIPRAHGSYDALLADPEVEAIYNPLPNDQHTGWSLAALKAGKHVLCEKPLGISALDAEMLVDAASNHAPHLKLMEAFMYRHHPQWQRARQIVSSGGVGTLRTIQTFFSYYNDDPNNIRNQAQLGGGAMADIGCYAVSLARFLFEAEPRRVLGFADFDPEFRTDRLVSGILDYGHANATFTCGTQLAPFQRVNIFGDKGRVEIDIPFNAPPDRPCTMRHQRDGRIEEIALPVCDQYAIQGDLFALAVRNDTPVPTPIADAVANMRVIDAVLHSAAHLGTWVEMAPAS